VYQVPYGKQILTFELPNLQVDIAEANSNHSKPIDIEEIIVRYAHHLLSTTSPNRPFVIAFTDATRASPDQALLEPLLRIFYEHQRQATLLCAVGMHRPSTHDEKIEKLGEWIVEHFPIIDHDPQNVVTIGEIEGVPVQINPMLQNAEILSVGVVEPHQYAGYSGGTKTVIIGCGGPQTISVTHGPQFLNMEGTRLGNIEGNPFQAFLRKAGTLLGHQHAINVITNENGEILHIATGHPHHVHDTLINIGRSLFETPVPNPPYDVVIAGVGAPKDANLYQASRGATYIGLSAHPVIRDGGTIILPAELPEGVGEGKGEQNMFDVLQRFGPTNTLIDYLLQNGCRPGEQRAFMIAQLMQKYRLIVVGAQMQNIVELAGLETAPSISHAIKMIEISSPKVLLVPHAIKTIPVPTTLSTFH